MQGREVDLFNPGLFDEVAQEIFNELGMREELAVSALPAASSGRFPSPSTYLLRKRKSLPSATVWRSAIRKA